MIPFPNEQVAFSDLIGPLKKSLLQLYKLKRTAANVATYDGYDFHFSVGATSVSPDEQLNTEGLEYNAERGREPVDVILMLAFQLGYSNAAVYYTKQQHQLLDMMKLLTETLNTKVTDKQ